MPSAGYLHDHCIQGRALLPGACMFEMGAAAARCMSSDSASSLLLGVSISAPLPLSATGTSAAEHAAILVCAASLGSGRLEVRSFQAAVSSRSQVHLAGWAGRASMSAARAAAASKLQQSALSSTVSAQQAGSMQQLPTAVARLLPVPRHGCGQPGGYAVHPAALDAATHTAAALADKSAADTGRDQNHLCFILFVHNQKPATQCSGQHITSAKRGTCRCDKDSSGGGGFQGGSEPRRQTRRLVGCGHAAGPATRRQRGHQLPLGFPAGDNCSHCRLPSQGEVPHSRFIRK